MFNLVLIITHCRDIDNIFKSQIIGLEGVHFYDFITLEGTKMLQLRIKRSGANLTTHTVQRHVVGRV